MPYGDSDRNGYSFVINSLNYSYCRLSNSPTYNRDKRRISGAIVDRKIIRVRSAGQRYGTCRVEIEIEIILSSILMVCIRRVSLIFRIFIGL